MMEKKNLKGGRFSARRKQEGGASIGERTWIDILVSSPYSPLKKCES